MSSIILKVKSEKFYYALNHNRRRREVVASGGSTAEEITLRVAQEFHRWKDKYVSTPHKALLESFYSRYCHVRLAIAPGNDARGGFIVLGGELMGLHSVDPGNGDWLMRAAIELGADRLDCFDVPHLVDLYQRHGFKEILREKHLIGGHPDVIWMRRDV